MSFRNEGKIKIFSNEGKPRDFALSRHALKDMIKEVFQTNEKSY